MIRAVSQSTPLRSVYRQHRGKHFHWLEAGDPEAPRIMLVHGFMASALAYRRVIARFADRYHLILPDLPAHGLDQSFRQTTVAPRFDSLVEWMRDFRDLHPGPIHVVGHSLGAMLCYEIAADDPTMRSLTLAGPGFRIPPSALSSYALDRLPAGLATLAANRLGLALYGPLNWRGEPMTTEEGEAYLRPLRDADRLGFMLKVGARLVEPRRLAPLAARNCPVLVVWGEHDHILPIEDAHWVADALHAELAIIADSGHSPMEDCPGPFSDALARFLQSV